MPSCEGKRDTVQRINKYKDSFKLLILVIVEVHKRNFQAMSKSEATAAFQNIVFVLYLS